MIEIPFTVDEYCKQNFVGKITEEDCFWNFEGDTSSIENYFKNNFENFKFDNNLSTRHVWKCCYFDYPITQQIVSNNPTLTKINKVLNISSSFIMEISKTSYVTWHYDVPRKGPAINLLLTHDSRSFSIFTNTFNDMSNIIECKYIPRTFCLYNTTIVHSILNFDKPRYLFSFVFERGKTDLEWKEAKNLIASAI